MDKVQFYNILNIENPDEFLYYENVAALFEEDSIIESNLIFDLLKDVDLHILLESTATYFEEFLNILPDFESELYILIDSIKTKIIGMIQLCSCEDEISTLSEEICKFRKWYSLDLLVYDKINNCEISIRDARYDLLASKLIGDETSFDFRLALDYDIEGCDYKLEVEFDDKNY